MIKLLGTLPSAIGSTNPDTVLTIPLAFPPGTVPDAGFASVSVQNGTNATLTQIALTFTPIVGGIPLALAYPVTVSVAAGAATTVQVPLTNGLDERPSLTLTFASAPTSGNCAARVVLMPNAPQVGLTGSLQTHQTYTNNVINALAITDTSEHVYTDTDPRVLLMTKKSVYVQNGLNEAVSVDLFLGDYSLEGPNGQNSATPQTVGAGQTAFIGGSTSIGSAGASGQESGVLNDTASGVGIGVSASTAPTSGTITVTLFGVL